MEGTLKASLSSLYVIQGELSVLLAVMKRTSKWSVQPLQEEEQDPLLKNLNQLKEEISKVTTLGELDLLSVLNPFLEVIRSKETTGPVTEIALSSVFKFISYRLVDPADPAAAAVMGNIADAVTHARFVGTEPGHDEVVLMKIIQVLRLLVSCSAGHLLSNESICEIMQSCFRICFESRLSELLRKTAENSIAEMVQLLFAQLPLFSKDDTKKYVSYKKLKMRTSTLDPSLNKNQPASAKTRPKHLPLQKDVPQSNEELKTSKPPSSVLVEPVEGNVNSANEPPTVGATEHLDVSAEEPVAATPGIASSLELATPVTSIAEETIILSENREAEGGSAASSTASECSEPKKEDQDPTNEEYVNPRGVRFTAESNEAEPLLIPYGLPCIRELLRFLISLINPIDRQNSEPMIHTGLRLLTVALETGADTVATIPSLLLLIQDETCRNLFSLLNSERLTLFVSATRLCFLLFEAMRTHLKFQLESYVSKLMDIVTVESPKIAYEKRIIALEAVNQLLRLPGLITELYLNYDCDLHSSDVFEDVSKLLAKSSLPVTGIYTTHMASLDALLVITDSVESHCHSRVLNQKKEGDLDDSVTSMESSVVVPPAARKSRFPPSSSIPSHEQLMAVKHKKKLNISGAEQFNNKYTKGIQFLQENGLLSDPLDPKEVVVFLRENPRLDKKMIGEYISNRKNLPVLEAFVKSFDFHGIRVDEALRIYLETFRLPGEAPLISLLLEHFAEHWHKCNNEPFANADAAFTLAYAVIMLNVDQHNHNVKKQNIPMTPAEFKRNLSKVNGGADFQESMLEEIYHSIKSEEIVMPAEQTGLVKENYLWKVLLRRGASKDGVFVHAPNGCFDHDLFSIVWNPTVSSLGYILERATDEKTLDKSLLGFRKVAAIAAHYSMSDVLDHVIGMLIKYSNLLQPYESASQLAVEFGSNSKSQAAAKTLYELVHKYGDIVRDGWKQVIECILQLYRCRLLPDELVEGEDFLDPSGKVKLLREEVRIQRSETSLLSSLYSYIALSEPSGARNQLENQDSFRKAKECVAECRIDQLIVDSKFLITDSLQELIKSFIASGHVAGNHNEHLTIFVLEMLIRITVQNRDRVTCIWDSVRDHVYSLVMGAAAAEQDFVLERSAVALLRLTGRLMRREDIAPIVLQSLRMLLLLKPQTLLRVSRQVSYGLHELLKTGAANVHTTGDWTVLFTLLECVGAGARPPRIFGGETANSDSESGVESLATSDRGYTSDSDLYENRKSPLATHKSSPDLSGTSPGGGGGWIVVGHEGHIEHLRAKQAPGREYSIVHDRQFLHHDKLSLVRSCESLSFLVRDVAHITPENFECAVQCIRTFVEATVQSYRGRTDQRGRPSQPGELKYQRSVSPSAQNAYDSEDSDADDVPPNYHQVPLQLLDLMHTLHTRAAQIYRWWAAETEDSPENTAALNRSLWPKAWCPLLQGIARLCCDSRKQVRTTAITYLQRSLLVHDLQSLTAEEWEACFNTVLFPLLAKLLEPLVGDYGSWEETRMRAATLLSKVLLQHLGPLSQLPTFAALWLTVLDFMDKYMHADHSELLTEAIPEMMKNMLLVMDTAGVFGVSNLEQTPLWNITWDRIHTFLPGLQEEITRSRTPVAREKAQQPESPPVTTPTDDPNPATFFDSLGSNANKSPLSSFFEGSSEQNLSEEPPKAADSETTNPAFQQISRSPNTTLLFADNTPAIIPMFPIVESNIKDTDDAGTELELADTTKDSDSVGNDVAAVPLLLSSVMMDSSIPSLPILSPVAVSQVQISADESTP